MSWALCKLGQQLDGKQLQAMLHRILGEDEVACYAVVTLPVAGPCQEGQHACMDWLGHTYWCAEGEHHGAGSCRKLQISCKQLQHAAQPSCGCCMMLNIRGIPSSACAHTMALMLLTCPLI